MPNEVIIPFFIIIFIVAFLINFIIDLIKIKKRKFKKMSEIQYLINKFDLDINKMNYKKISFIISLINAFIMATVTTVISKIDAPMIIQLLCGFILLFAMIYGIYELYGRKLRKNMKKKGSKK